MENELIDKVLKQIKKDIEIGDVTAIEVLLESISKENLEAFLPESDLDSEVSDV